MMMVNHAVTGALIGLTVDEPAAALPLAFLSHFALDAIPHYDPKGSDKAELIRSDEFFWVQLVLNGTLCVALVVVLFIVKPKNWLTAAICAFLGTSPDLMWLPRYISIKKTGRDTSRTTRLRRFHSRIQWLTGPRLLFVELVWLGVTGALLAIHL